MASGKRLLNLAKLLLGWPFSLLAIAFIVKFLLDNSKAITPWLTTIDKGLLVVSIISFLVYYSMRAFTWGLLMEMMGQKINIRDNFYAWQFSEIKRYIPGSIWSFLSRANLFEKLGVSKTNSGKAILFEIEFLILSNMIISFLGFSLIPEYFKQSKVLILIAFTLITFIVAITVIMGHKLNSKVSKIFPNFGIARNFMLLIFYLITYLFLSLGMYFAVKSILNIYNFLTIIGFFSFSFLIGYLSLITPSGLGVREGVITFGLSTVITAPVAGLVAIFSRIVLVFSELLFTGIVYVWHKSKL